MNIEWNRIEIFLIWANHIVISRTTYEAHFDIKETGLALRKYPSQYVLIFNPCYRNMPMFCVTLKYYNYHDKYDEHDELM